MNIGHHEAPKGCHNLQAFLPDGTVVWWRVFDSGKLTCFVRRPGQEDYKQEVTREPYKEDDDD